MKQTATLACAAMAMALGAAAASAQTAPQPASYFEFDVERVVLLDEANAPAIHERLVREAGAYCAGLVSPATAEYGQCVTTMVRHVVTELDHAPLTRFHDSVTAAAPLYHQTVAHNAG